MRSFVLLLQLALLTAIVPAAVAQGPSNAPVHQSTIVTNQHPGASDQLAKLKPVFIANNGQWNPEARYMLQSPGLNLWITNHGVIYDLHRNQQNDSADAQALAAPHTPEYRVRHTMPDTTQAVVEHATVEMKFLGTTPEATALGRDKLRGVNNYYFGNDPSQWTQNVPTYGEARIENLYEGIDAVFYLDNGRPRYDLVVKPDADPSQVRMSFQGADKMWVEIDGSLVLSTRLGEIRQRELFAYQVINGHQQEVRCAFQLRGNHIVGFAIEPYDRTLELMIDPIIFSTYLGGISTDISHAASVDNNANVYITGQTISLNFPVLNPEQGSRAGQYDSFLTKFDSSGNIIFSTYFGGISADYGYGCAVDSNGHAYITGLTLSPNFPTLNAVQSSNAGGTDAFVAKFDSSGALVYSTYFGGTGSDRARGIAVDNFGTVFFAGTSGSTDFPTANAEQSSNATLNDAFVASLDSVGGLVYSTYLGGDNDDEAYGIATDDSSNAFVVGRTTSSDFPTLNALQSSKGSDYDVFVTKYSSNGTMAYSTYLGGDADDWGNGIATDDSSNAYITGYTSSTDYPVLNAYQSTGNSSGEAFLTKLSSDGSLAYSTYLGGDDLDEGYCVAVDGMGNAYIAGYAWSTDFPINTDIQTSNAGNSDGFVTRFDSVGSLSHSTFLGGASLEYCRGIAIAAQGNVYVSGQTLSTNFPTLNAAQSSLSANYDAFLTRLYFFIPTSSMGEVTLISPVGSEHWCAGSDQAITWSSTDVSNIMIEYSSDGGDNWTTINASTPAGDESYTWTVPSDTGSDYRVRISDASDSDISATSDDSFTIHASATLNVKVEPSVIWSMNHAMRTIDATVTVTGGYDPVVSLYSIESSEDDDGLEIDDLPDDIQNADIGTDDRSFDLRAEAAPEGTGRLYTITYRVEDSGCEDFFSVILPSLPYTNTVFTGPIITTPDVQLEPADPAVLVTTTSISYTIPDPCATRLGLYGMDGMWKMDLQGNELKAAGTYTIVWDGNMPDTTPLPNGTYIYRLKACSVSRVGVITIDR